MSPFPGEKVTTTLAGLVFDFGERVKHTPFGQIFCFEKNIKQKILRFWGLTGQRGWARLILDHLHDLVLSPAIPRAVRSTQTRSRTNTTVTSFQTTDTVLPMPPASAGATAAEVLECFL